MKRLLKTPDGAFAYTLIRSNRKDILFQALPKGVTRVYAPSYMRLREMDAMVLARLDELKALHEKVAAIEEKNAPEPILDGQLLRVYGRDVRICILPHNLPRAQLYPDRLLLCLPDITDQTALRALVKAALSKEALRVIRERLDFFAPQLGRAPGRVTIRDQKSRWGSLSSKGNLNFNWKLILAPVQALDYVVIHELCHLQEFNHSRRFWALVKQQMPEYEAWKNWLKDNGKSLWK